MIKNIFLTAVILLASVFAFAQDEGNVVIRDRFERDKTIYFSLGPAFTLGQNLGDYSAGFNVETGFLKRANRLISWGPSVSYLGFVYDELKTYPYYYYAEQDIALELKQTGGSVSILSLGLNLKLNLIPVSDNTKFSIYGIVNPFVSYVNRSEVVETADEYYDEDGDGVYADYLGTVTYSADTYPALASENKVSGGAHFGFGIEFMPAKKISFFAQATFSYTLPITYIATETFLKNEDQYLDAEDTIYYDASQSLFLEEFPIVKRGFSAVSVKVGMAINF